MSRTSNSLARRSVTRRRNKNPGVQRLCQAADNLVGEHGPKIAEALNKGSLNGNASSARLLYQLADGAEWVNDEEAVAKVISMAAIWKNEPEWTGPPQACPPVEHLEPPLLTDGQPASK